MRERHETRYIVVHTAATPPSMDIGADTIRRWHLNRGWGDIGYHYVIRRDGTVDKGRDLWRQGAHVRSHNSDSVGICMVGGLNENTREPENNYTPMQFASLYNLIFKIIDNEEDTGRLDSFDDVTVLGHRDFDGVNKACPCFDVRAWFKSRIDAPDEWHDHEEADLEELDDVKKENAPVVLKIIRLDADLYVCSEMPTLWDIADRYGIDLDELINANKHLDPLRLQKGDGVYLP